MTRPQPPGSASSSSSSASTPREATADTPVPSSAAGPHVSLRAAFVGGGNMATALIGGLVDAGVAASQVHVIEPVAAQRDRLLARFPGLRVHERAEPAALTDANIVVLAVKPQHLRDAARELASLVQAVPVVLSIAAGIRIADLSRWLGGYTRIVRAMPNTPALVGKGITGVHAGPAVGHAARDTAALVLEAGGAVQWFDAEADLDTVTGLSSSGVAYVFYVLEALEEAGVAQGLPRATARELAYATLEGSVALARASGDEPAQLRANVTSKGGTTERGLAALQERGVDEALRAAVAAATARAREMGDELGAA